MTTTTAPPPTDPSELNDEAAFSDATLRVIPALTTPLTPADMIAALDRLARRGKLPGFDPRPDHGFTVSLFGEPFDMDLIAEAAPAGPGARLTFRTRVRGKAPAVLAGAIAVSIWPGLPLMDAVIPAAWGWWPTWWWYLPLVVGPLPFVLPGMFRKSRAAATDHLHEQLARIASAITAVTDRDSA